MPRITFTSAKFLPFLPEACQVNPGAYGFELALWLAQTLMQANLPTSYPLSEDWGWFIEYNAGGAELMIGCAAQADEGEGYTGQPVAWSIFVKPHRSLKQRLLRTPATAVVGVLTAAILAALRAEGIAPVLEEAS